MAEVIGQIVPSVKAIVSKVNIFPIGHIRQMANTNEELLFNRALCDRVKRLREERGWTAAQMSTALGVPAERYRKYESRSPMPSYLMTRFCLIVGVELDYLVTGKSRSSKRA